MGNYGECAPREGSEEREMERSRNKETGSKCITRKYTDHKTTRERSARGKEGNWKCQWDESDRVFGFHDVITSFYTGGWDETLPPLLDQRQNMKLKIRQRTWIGRVKVTSSDLCVAVGLFFGPKNVNKKTNTQRMKVRATKAWDNTDICGWQRRSLRERKVIRDLIFKYQRDGELIIGWPEASTSRPQPQPRRPDRSIVHSKDSLGLDL